MNLEYLKNKFLAFKKSYTKCKKIFIYLFFFFIACSCKEKFIANITSPNTGYLVVEGFISSGQSPTTITLSRTLKLYDSINVINELNAIVTIESENNEIFPVYENGNGVYTSASLNLNNNEKYRLSIVTQDNKQYASDFVPVKHTPDIDSISWERIDGGLKIFANTHDPQNNTRYYQWKYEETWEIHSEYRSTLKLVTDPTTGQLDLVWRDPVSHLDDTLIYKCWQNYNSTNILLASSEKLSEDKIHVALLSIEPQSEKLSILYSIHLRQYALSRDAYFFFQKIKKNTEQVGSIFDAQPSELKGNIHCLTDPAEIVVGYVDISEEKEKRIFISNDQVPDWNYTPDCPTVVIAVSNLGDAAGLEPINPSKLDGFGGVLEFRASFPLCVDCTLKGTNIKPAFWP